MKRFRKPKAKPGELLVKWGDSKEGGPDVYYCWGEGVPKRDGSYLQYVLGCTRANPLYPSRPGESSQEPSLLDGLKSRGYDLTTLRFSIKKIGAK